MATGFGRALVVEPSRCGREGHTVRGSTGAARRQLAGAAVGRHQPRAGAPDRADADHARVRWPRVCHSILLSAFSIEDSPADNAEEEEPKIQSYRYPVPIVDPPPTLPGAPAAILYLRYRVLKYSRTAM